MKYRNYLLLVSFLAFAACNNNTADSVTKTEDDVIKPLTVESIVILPTMPDQTDTIKKSLKAKAEGTIGKSKIRIDYHSPAVRSRVIWGGLVPLDQVWVTGAHRATSLETDTDLVIGGKKITAGKYALFSIPGKDEWTIVINKKWDQHLTDDYDANDDLVRLSVKPEMMNTVQERLMYQLKAENDFTGSIEMSWEKIKVKIPLQVL